MVNQDNNHQSVYHHCPKNCSPFSTKSSGHDSHPIYVTRERSPVQEKLQLYIYIYIFQFNIYRSRIQKSYNEKSMISVYIELKKNREIMDIVHDFSLEALKFSPHKSAPSWHFKLWKSALIGPIGPCGPFLREIHHFHRNHIIPIGSMVLLYMLTWLGYIDGKC